MKSFAIGTLSAIALLAAAPFVPAAQAQVFSSQRRPQTEAGQVPAQNQPRVAQSSTLDTRLEQDETLYLNRRETYDYDLVLQSSAVIGGQRLPVGAIIRGQFQPAEGGLVYVADSVELANRILPLRASSELMRDRKDPRETSTGAILTDAAIGAVGGYVLSEVFGDSSLWEIAGGAAAGVLVGNTTAPLVVVVRPDEPIVLFAD